MSHVVLTEKCQPLGFKRIKIRQVKEGVSIASTASDFAGLLPVLWCHNLSWGCGYYMVQDSHCWGDIEIMGLEASISWLPQQLLKAASHLQHQGADWALYSHTSLSQKSQWERAWFECSLCHFLEMFHWPAMKTWIWVGVALSPFSQKSLKGFNKLWV